MAWTSEQLEAINGRGSNLLVAAAAGAGKTAVLVERIIKIITDEENPIDIDRLLVVTFTNAAASEMRERIGKSISEKLSENPNSKNIQRQLALLSKARITTIHSFCLDVIKRNFHSIDIDPDFRVGDETETVLMKDEALSELFEEKYLKSQYNRENNAADNDSFLELMEAYGGNKNDSSVFDMVMDLYNFSMSNPWPYDWINSMTEKFKAHENFKFGASPWAHILMQNIQIELSGMIKSLTKALKIIESCETLKAYEENFKEDIAMLNDAMESCHSYEVFYESLASLEFKTLKRCGKDVDKEKQKFVKDIRDNVKKRLNDIKGNILAEDAERINKEIKELYPLMRALGNLVIEFNERYMNSKRRRNIVDFNDFEHMCLEILAEKDESGNIVPSKAALEIRDKYDEILIDEYQDSNMVQEVIMSMISKKEKPNLFMVGDVKQSIYRFRQANPRLFLEKYNTYSEEKKAENRKILLYKNFRSRKEVLDGVNFVFKQIMSETIGELNYDHSEFLNPGAEYRLPNTDKMKVGGDIELYVIEKAKDKDKVEDEASIEEENVSDIMLEARMVGKRILELMEEDEEEKEFSVFEKDTGEYRRVKFSDIVILLRSTKNWASIFSEELMEMGIPVFSDANSGYFESPEIKTMLSLLQIIDNPRQDIPFVAVLRSPIGGFSVEELIDIKEFQGDTFYEKFISVEKLCEEQESSRELCIKIKDFYDKLLIWRKEALYMPIDEFIWYLYTETGYYGYVGAVKGGAQRQANLKMLFERARDYNETSYRGVFNFINFINKVKVSSGDMGSATILGEGDNVVRIMSIHKSKGLEFPVVFVSGCGKQFNLRDINKPILFHNELGFGPDYVNLEKRVSYSTLMKEAIKNRIKLETLSEEMRILYVAFTRAREKLIITGAVADTSKAASKWAADIESYNEKLSEDVILKGKTYLDWIGASIIRHEAGKDLRDLVEVPFERIEFIKDESKWKIHLLKREEILKASSDLNYKDAEEEEKFQKFNLKLKEIKTSDHESEYYDEINRRLNFKYSFEEASKLPSLISVTELKRRFSEENEYASRVFIPALSKKPLFLEEINGLTPAEKGTALHSAMQHLKLPFEGEEISTEAIRSQINDMVINELLTEKQAETININKIFKFLSSDLGRRIIKSPEVHREFPFQVNIKSTDIYENLPEELYKDENIMLQGIIDLYFMEGNEIVLLDYKTDYVTNDNIEEIKNRYLSQINYYSHALEKVTGMKVKEKYLYLFSSGSFVKL